MTGLPFSLDLVSFLPPFHSTRRHRLGELLTESYFLRMESNILPNLQLFLSSQLDIPLRILSTSNLVATSISNLLSSTLS